MNDWWFCFQGNGQGRDRICFFELEFNNSFETPKWGHWVLNICHLHGDESNQMLLKEDMEGTVLMCTRTEQWLPPVPFLSCNPLVQYNLEWYPGLHWRWGLLWRWECLVGQCPKAASQSTVIQCWAWKALDLLHLAVFSPFRRSVITFGSGEPGQCTSGKSS